MKFKKIFPPIFFALLAITLLFSSCATEETKGKTAAEVLYKDAMDLMDSGRYIMATEKLNQIKSKYPYSFYATHAELLLADILYDQENYVEAAAAYLLFRDFHPKHDKIEYVIWRIAESYYKQLPSTYDRDLTSGEEAIKHYKEILRTYPNSEYVKASKKKISEIQDMFRKKEKYIADFYFKTDVYEAAEYRYLKIIKEYQKPELVEYAKVRAAESARRRSNFKDCMVYADQFISELSEKNRKKIQNTRKLCSQKVSD
ncbi:MAG: outer membrane protein assembly factor BamD [Bacteriovoracia bacterium]